VRSPCRERSYSNKYTNRMIHAVNKKSQYGEKVANTSFGALVLSSQEEFMMLLVCKNGFQKWVWMHNELVAAKANEASNGDTSDGSPGYIYTETTSDLTRRKWAGQGGWDAEIK
jgi:hypothetical protein